MKKLDELIAERQERQATTPPESKAATTEPPCPDCSGARFQRVEDERDAARFGKAEPCATCNTERGPVSGIPRIFRDATFETYDLDRNPETERWYNACQAFCGYVTVERSGEMLMLHGDPGRGKTHLMVAAIRALNEAKIGAIFWEVTELLASLRAAVGTGTVEQEINTIASFEGALALDDIGPENKSGFGEENLYRIINRRWSNELPTIATCNSRLDDIDPRIRSRFKAGWIYCDGKDMREPDAA